MPTPVLSDKLQATLTDPMFLPSDQEDINDAVWSRLTALQTMVSDIAYALHGTRWSQAMMMADVAHLCEQAGPRPKALSNPNFVTLLTDELQRYVMEVPPKPLARHKGEETEATREIKIQRNECFMPHFDAWILNGVTWGKTPDEVKVRIITQMALPPANWDWRVTIARVSDFIGYQKTKAKRNRSRGSKTPSPHKRTDSKSSSKKVTRSVQHIFFLLALFTPLHSLVFLEFCLCVDYRISIITCYIMECAGQA